MKIEMTDNKNVQNGCHEVCFRKYVKLQYHQGMNHWVMIFTLCCGTKVSFIDETYQELTS